MAPPREVPSNQGTLVINVRDSLPVFACRHNVLSVGAFSGVSTIQAAAQLRSQTTSIAYIVVIFAMNSQSISNCIPRLVEQQTCKVWIRYWLDGSDGTGNLGGALLYCKTYPCAWTWMGLTYNSDL